MRRSLYRKLRIIYALLFMPPSLLLIGISIWLYLGEVESNLALVKKTEALQLVQSRYVLENHLQNAIRDLMYIANSDNVRQLVNTPVSRRNHEVLARDFKTMIEKKGFYDQIRYIGLNGKEVVRVNYRKGDGIIVPNLELQRKEGRYYFKEAMLKGRGEVFISPLDLNMEHGVIESPYKPMIRLATPVYDDKASKQGILIINYLAGKILASLNQNGAIPLSRLMLLNSDGYWLKGETPADEWGFMFPGKNELKMVNRYPDAWRIISGGESGQFRNENGLFTYDTVFVDRLQNDMYPKAGVTVDANTRSALLWKLVRYIPNTQLNKPELALAKRYLAVNVILLFCWAVAALALSRARLFTIEAKQQIHEREKRISEIVNSAFDAIITINERGVIETFNPAACKMFDYREGDVVGQKVNMLMASPNREYHDLHIQNYIESGEGRFIGKPGRVTGLRSDGTAVEIEICIGAKQIDDHWLFTAICRRYQVAEQ